ncbi:hypothetical protein H7J86_24550 [Mycobacterium hackensackense]|nr:hypothetical protein [Mycobacterium hackensackense]
MPGFRDTGMSDEQARDFIGSAATVAAEAITHLIETNFDLIAKGEAAQLRQAAAAPPEGVRIIHVHPGALHEPAVLSLTVGNTDHVVVPRSALAAAGVGE